MAYHEISYDSYDVTVTRTRRNVTRNRPTLFRGRLRSYGMSVKNSFFCGDEK